MSLEDALKNAGGNWPRNTRATTSQSAVGNWKS